MTYEEKNLYLPKVHLLIYVYYVQLYVPIYVACENYPMNPWISVTSITAPMLIMFTHALTLFVLILRFCIVY